MRNDLPVTGLVCYTYVFIYNYGPGSFLQSVCNYSFTPMNIEKYWKIKYSLFSFWSLLTDFFLPTSLNTNLTSILIFQLWAELRLPAEPFPDKETCWHGSGIYEDCNNKLWQRNAMIRYQVTTDQATLYYTEDNCRRSCTGSYSSRRCMISLVRNNQ